MACGRTITTCSLAQRLTPNLCQEPSRQPCIYSLECRSHDRGRSASAHDPRLRVLLFPKILLDPVPDPQTHLLCCLEAVCVSKSLCTFFFDTFLIRLSPEHTQSTKYSRWCSAHTVGSLSREMSISNGISSHVRSNTAPCDG